MVTKIFHYQYRDLECTYLFQSKDGRSLTLKVYDTSCRRLGNKIPLHCDPNEIAELFENRELRLFSPLIQEIQRTNPNLALTLPNLCSNFSTEINRMIELVASQIPSAHADEELFTDVTFTYEIFRDPVVDNCGHTFERSSITRHMEDYRGRCPISRRTITQLTPNRQLQLVIEKFQFQSCPIPILGLFKRESEHLTQCYLQAAETCIQERDYEEAISNMKNACLHTQKWEDYQHISHLFREMGMIDKALLASLYLLKYQMEANAWSKTSETLDILIREELQPAVDKTLRSVLIQLYFNQEEYFQVQILAHESAEKYRHSDPVEAALFYKYAIFCGSSAPWTYCNSLATILTKPEEKAHFFLKGACCAIESRAFSASQELYESAVNAFPSPFLNHRVQLEALNSNPRQLKAKLKELCLSYERQGDFRQAIRVYRCLTQVEVSSSICIQMIRIQSQLSIPKSIGQALKWLSYFLQRNNYASALRIAQTTPPLFSRCARTDSFLIPLYEQLIVLYTHENSDLLRDILNRAAEAYENQGGLERAEEHYQTASEKFFSLEQTLSLAQILEKREKFREAALTYYKALKNFYTEDTRKSEQILNQLLRIDPSLDYLSSPKAVAFIRMQQERCRNARELQMLRRTVTMQQNTLARIDENPFSIFFRSEIGRPKRQ